MLISISGSQGSGKTTVLNELAKSGLKVVERKTARSVMSEQFPGMTLDDIYADPLLAMRWQDLILQRKYLDEIEAVDSEELWFTERSYADLFTYAVMAVGKNNIHSEWVDSYYDECKKQNARYLECFFIHGGLFKPVDDGVRGINQHYATMIDVTIHKFLQQMAGFHEREHDGTKYVTPKLTDVGTSEIAERVRLVTTVSMNRWLEERK